MIVDHERALAREERHRAVARREPALDVERLPRRRLLVLADAIRVAAGMAHGRHRDLAGAGATHIYHDQPQRASDRRVGAIAGAEHTRPAVHAEPLPDGAADDDRR